MYKTTFSIKIKTPIQSLGFCVADVELDNKNQIINVKLRNDQHIILPYLKDETPIKCDDKKYNILKIKTLGELRNQAMLTK